MTDSVVCSKEFCTALVTVEVARTVASALSANYAKSVVIGVLRFLLRFLLFLIIFFGRLGFDFKLRFLQVVKGDVGRISLRNGGIPVPAVGLFLRFLRQGFVRQGFLFIFCQGNSSLLVM